MIQFYQPSGSGRNHFIARDPEMRAYAEGLARDFYARGHGSDPQGMDAIMLRVQDKTTDFVPRMPDGISETQQRIMGRALWMASHQPIHIARVMAGEFVYDDGGNVNDCWADENTLIKDIKALKAVYSQDFRRIAPEILGEELAQDFYKSIDNPRFKGMVDALDRDIKRARAIFN